MQFHMISEHPTIVVSSAFDLSADGFDDLIGKSSGNRKIHLLRLVWWGFQHLQDLFAQENRILKKKYPNVEITHLCNSREDYELAQKTGLLAIYCNHNALLDERIFRPLSKPEKIFDAVYNANFEYYKRHYLCKEISNLALIGYSYRDATKEMHDYVGSIHEELPNAKFLNHSNEKGFTIFGPEEVVNILNQSKVGLCLSWAEGAMYASAEYLLCGLPIVSTKSLGGRDVFFDEEYVRIVEDDPAEVAKAVKDLGGLQISPDYIRRKTLEKMKTHREVFNRYIQEIFRKEGVICYSTDGWPGAYVNKMLKPYEKEKVVIRFERLKKDTSNLFEILPWNGAMSAVSLMFNGLDQNYLELVAPELTKRGLCASFNLVARHIDRDESWRELVSKGHKIGNLSLDCLHAAGLSEEEAETQVQGAKNVILEKLGFQPLTFVYPFAEITERLQKAVGKENFLALGRDRNSPFLFADVEPDWLDIPFRNVKSSYPFETYRNWISWNIIHRSWFILVINGLEGSPWA